MIPKNKSIQQICAVNSCQKSSQYKIDCRCIWKQKIVIPLCNVHYQINQNSKEKNTIPNAKENLQIVFYTYYLNNPAKKREIARFASYVDVPKQEKENGTIIINGISWRIASVRRLDRQQPCPNTDISEIVSDSKVTTIEIILEKTLQDSTKNRDDENSRGERLMSCLELWDN